MKTFLVNQSLIFFLKKVFPKSLKKNSVKQIKKNIQGWRKAFFIYRFRQLKDELKKKNDPIQKYQVILGAYEQFLNSFITIVFYNGFQEDELNLVLDNILKKVRRGYKPSSFIIADYHDMPDTDFNEDFGSSPTERLSFALFAHYKFELKLLAENRVKIDEKEFSNFINGEIKKLSIFE